MIVFLATARSRIGRHLSGWRRATNQRGPGFWPCIAAVLLLLVMPSHYRGGAEVAHAHAIFQFWLPGGADAAHHHGHAHDHDLPPGAAIASEATEASATPSPAPPDAPVLSEMTFTVDGFSQGALALAVFVLRSLPIHRLIISIATSLSAITLTPDPPPPR